MPAGSAVVTAIEYTLFQNGGQLIILFFFCEVCRAVSRSFFLGAVFACGYSGVRVAAFFEKLAHFLAFVVKVGVVTAEASQSEELREWDDIFYVLWMRGRMYSK